MPHNKSKVLLFSLFLILSTIFIINPQIVFAATAGPNFPSTTADDPSIGIYTWSSTGNITVSDDVRSTSPNIGSNTITHYLKATGFGFSIPTGATINGIQVEWERSKIAGPGNVLDNTVRIIKGGVIGSADKSNTTPWSTSDSFILYGGATDLWGNTWTAADINSPTFGVALSTILGGVGNPAQAGVDAVRIVVNYTSSSTDITAPTTPTGLVTFAPISWGVNLFWNPSTDPDDSVIHYRVYKLNTATSAYENIGSPSVGYTSYGVMGLASNTTFTYKVSAYDNAGNESLLSAPITITTPPYKFNIGDQVAVTGNSIPLLNGPNGTQTQLVYQSNGGRIIGGIPTYIANRMYWNVTFYYSYPSNTTVLATGWMDENYLMKDIAPTIPTNLYSNLFLYTSSGSPQMNVAVYWDESSDNVEVSKYKVYRNGAFVSLADSLSKSISDYNVSAGTHNYTVSAIDAAGNESAQSAVLSVVVGNPLTDITPPMAPSALITTVGSARISLSWAGSTDPDNHFSGYRIYRTSPGNCCNLFYLATTTTTSYVDSYLISGEDYKYEVSAYDTASNESVHTPTTGWITAGVDTTSPTVPTGLTAFSNALGNVTLSWNKSTDPDSSVTGYKIYRNNILTAFQSSTNSSTITYTQDEGAISPGNPPLFSVAAYDGIGNGLNTSAQSASVSPFETTDTTSPLAPTGLSATTTSSSQINLSWTASTDNVGVTRYVILRNGVEFLGGTTTTTSYSDTGLSPSTSYTYSIRAYDAANNFSSPSVTASATTLSSTPNKFNISDRVTVTTNALNVRSTANGTLVGTQSLNALGTVIGGPVTAGGYTWWQIDYDVAPDGWSVENWLERYTPSSNPTITTISPASVAVGSPALTLTINGNNFVSTSVVNLNGSARTTTYASVTQLTAAIPASDLTTAGNYNITVANGSTISNAVSLTVTSSTPGKFNIGDRVIVTGTVNVRQTAGGTLLGTQPVNTLGTVLAGPITTSDYIWWQIDYDTGVDGWSIENRLEIYTPLPPSSDTLPPSVPTGLTATPSTSSLQINLSWNPSTDNVGMHGYRIYRNGTYHASSLTTSYSDVGLGVGFALSSSTTYSYTVSAEDVSGIESLQSAPISATTVNKFNIGDRVIVIFSSSVRDNPSDINIGSQLQGNLGTVIGGPVAGAYTWWQINYDTGVDGWSIENWLERYETTTPSAPTSFTALAPYANRINLSWNPSTDNVGVMRYQIYRNSSDPGGFKNIQINDPNTISFIDQGSYYSERQDGLYPNTTYTYTITAFDAAGNESSPASVTVTTPSTLSYSPPTGLTASVTSGVYLDWTFGQGSLPEMRFYHIYRDGALYYVIDKLAASAQYNGTYFYDLNVASPYNYTYTVAAGDQNGAITTQSLSANPSIAAAPTITSLSPASKLVNSLAFTLTVNGTNLVSGSTVKFNGSARTTTYVSPTRLTASIPATDLTTTGTYNITVSSPSGETSNSMPLAVTSGTTTNKFNTGDRARVTSTNLRVRSSAGGPILGNQPYNARGTIVGGPILQSFHYWYNINYDNGVDGWSAQNWLRRVPSGTNPTITSISPVSKIVGNPAFTLTVSGTNFTTTSVVKFNGSARTTTFVSATQVTAVIPATDLVAAGTYTITVANASTISNGVSLLVTAPSGPTITSISPSTIPVNSPATTITVTGTGFSSGMFVKLDANALATTNISSTQLSAEVPLSYLTTLTTYSITAFDSFGGGATSNAVTLTVSGTPMTITSISPISVIAGSLATTLTVNGTGFTVSPATYISFDGTSLTTTYVSATQLTATIPASNLINSGPYTISVFNANNVGSINTMTFTVDIGPTPSLTGLVPHSTIAGGAAFSLGISGNNFPNNAVARWNGSNRTTTYISEHFVYMSVLASDLTTAGSRNITVFNPTSGNSSGSLQFVVSSPPTITSISPSSVSYATFNNVSGFGTTINGTNFLPESFVGINYNPVDGTGYAGFNKTYISSTQISVSIYGGGSPGAYNFVVINPSAAVGQPGQTSNVATLTVTP